MADEKTYRRPSLNYSTSNSFMESYGKALKPTWQRGKKSMASGISDAITGALGKAYTSYEAGRAITAAQEGKWEDATTRDAWNTKEQYDAFIKLEESGKEAYLEAVRTGSKEEQAKLLAEQAERKSSLTGWGESATLAIDNDSKVGWASSNRVYSPVDQYMVGEVVQNRNVTYRMEDGQMQIGIDYSELYNNELTRDQIGIPGISDPNRAQWMKENGYELKDGKLTRYVTKGQFDKTVTGAIAPTVMAKDLTATLDGFQKSGATDGSYFDEGQTSIDFQRTINKENLKTIMHEPLVGGKSWADEVLEADGVWSDVEAALYAKITPLPASADTNGDGRVSRTEQIAAQEFIFNELEKDENADIVKEEIGNWFAGKAKARFDLGFNSTTDITPENKVKQTTRAGVSGPAGNNRATS